jgi:N-hydroxyarylamine O-acetyltransferase
MWVDTYLRRTGVADAIATLDSLQSLHVAHRETFLFENLDIQRGLPVRVDVPSIARKFLDENRGGYCFEHNTLFGAVLREAGFEVASFLGRVRRGPPDRWMRTHMLLRVVLAGEPWIADVGFGGIGLLEPLPLADGVTATQGGITYTLRREGPHWVLSMHHVGGAEMDLYEFAEEPQTEGDIEIANHYTSTHPESIFRKSISIQRASREERAILRFGTFTRYQAGTLAEESPVGRERLPAIARRVFNVDLGEGPFVFEGYESG